MRVWEKVGLDADIGKVQIQCEVLPIDDCKSKRVTTNNINLDSQKHPSVHSKALPNGVLIRNLEDSGSIAGL